MSPKKIISETTENYLKAIYHLCREEDGFSTQSLAERLGVSSPAVTKMLRQLAANQFITYEPYHAVSLTPLGEEIALEVIRHHRLLELYLVETLGFGWDQVHDEAERLEHHISEEFEARIERILGFPAFDPHGDFIPARDGTVPPLVTDTLDAQAGPARMVVRRVADENSALLVYFAERGLRPGASVRLLDREPFGGALRLEVAGQEHRVTPEAARSVFVEKIATD